MTMQEMNKEFVYCKYKFNIKVELNSRIEKTPNGKIWHNIIVNDMGVTNYYKKREVEDSLLLKTISDMENDAKLWVDNRTENISKPDSRLSDLGFK
jgi:hypothetical protein